MSGPTCHQCGQQLQSTAFTLDCPGCRALFHACCWPAHGAACLSLNPAKPLMGVVEAAPPPHVPLLPPVPADPSQPVPIATHPARCRGCLALVPDGRPFCFECGHLPHYLSAPRRFALLIEGAASVRIAQQSVPLLTRLVPTVSRDELADRLSRLPVLLFIDTEQERLFRLQRRLEQGGLRVRIYPDVSRSVVAREFLEQFGRNRGLMLELAALTAVGAFGLVVAPWILGAALAAGGYRLVAAVRRFIDRFTVPAHQFEPVLHPLAGERGERIRQTFVELREPGVKELARQSLKAYEQAIAAAQSGGEVLEHLWQPVEPMLTRYLEQIMVLSARVERLEHYLRDHPEGGNEAVARLETPVAGDQLRLPARGAQIRQRREDVAGAARLMRARLERSVMALQSLRGSLLHLGAVEEGQGASLDALSTRLESEIEAMSRTIGELERFRA